MPRRRGSKYKNQPIEIDGHRFDSKAEGERYLHLANLAAGGDISNLKLQPRFPIVINNRTVCTYIADFAYRDSTGRTVIEDVKGMRTDIYRLKKKLVEATYPGTTITEIEKDQVQDDPE